MRPHQNSQIYYTTKNGNYASDALAGDNSHVLIKKSSANSQSRENYESRVVFMKKATSGPYSDPKLQNQSSGGSYQMRTELIQAWWLDTKIYKHQFYVNQSNTRGTVGNQPVRTVLTNTVSIIELRTVAINRITHIVTEIKSLSAPRTVSALIVLAILIINGRHDTLSMLGEVSRNAGNTQSISTIIGGAEDWNWMAFIIFEVVVIQAICAFPWWINIQAIWDLNLNISLAFFIHKVKRKSFVAAQAFSILLVMTFAYWIEGSTFFDLFIIKVASSTFNAFLPVALDAVQIISRAISAFCLPSLTFPI